MQNSWVMKLYDTSWDSMFKVVKLRKYVTDICYLGLILKFDDILLYSFWKKLFWEFSPGMGELYRGANTEPLEPLEPPNELFL